MCMLGGGGGGGGGEKYGCYNSTCSVKEVYDCLQDDHL